MRQIIFTILITSFVFSSTITKTAEGFVLTSRQKPVLTTQTGFAYTGRIVWESGEPYVHGLVFVSEGKTRAWEYVGTTDSNGTFVLPVKPYTQFKLYAWDGVDKTFNMYDGHFYYNPELDNLYMTPTGREPFIADKGDVIIVDIDTQGK